MCIFNLNDETKINDDEILNLKYSLVETNIAQKPNPEWGYNSKINEFRNKIDNINSDDWKKIRWFINEYDFVVKDPIINRAFFKYWEMINEFGMFENYQEDDIILHCAEAPGGFIQASNIFLQLDNSSMPNTKVKNEPDEDGFICVKPKRKSNKKKYKIYTISLNKDLPEFRNYNLPSYNKNILHKQLCITYGKDNTGNINNWENINYLKNLTSQNYYLITADGGFDEGNDFNNKEQLHYSLILSEIYAAIKLQKMNGNFILKMFDVFTDTSIHLLYLLSLCYEEVVVYKPKTSRPTNSEKYVICKNFKLNENLRNHVLFILEKLHEKIIKQKTKYIMFSLFDTIPENFKENIKKMNHSILMVQCAFLEKALLLCSNKEFLNEYEKNLEKCFDNRKNTFIEWENQYGLNSFI